MNLELNIGTALVASVCLGIAVDDTIHFLNDYYHELSLGNSSFDAIMNIYKTTAVALTMTTVILVSGFSLYMLGSFVPNIYFGIICSIVLTCALIVDLVFLPALLFQIDKTK